jgi:hypothetical protein
MNRVKGKSDNKKKIYTKRNIRDIFVRFRDTKENNKGRLGFLLEYQ